MFRLNKINSLILNSCRTAKLLRCTEHPVRIPVVNYSISKPLFLQDEPYKFRGSRAEKLTMDESFYNVENLHPSKTHQKYVVAACFLVFGVYFGILREENHIDEQLKGDFTNAPTSPAYEFQLMLKYDYAKRNGMPYKHLEEQINEIRRAKGLFPI